MKRLNVLLIAVIMLATQAGCTRMKSAAGIPHDPMPVFAQGTRILFQGDSITDGNRDKSVKDPNHILGHGYQFIIACKYGGDLAERRLTFMNRGISGNTVRALRGRWQKDALDLKPDLLSILIGVNDLGGGRGDVKQYEQQYDQLLADTIKALPKVKLVLCEPFGLPVGGKQAIWAQYQPKLAEYIAVVNRLGEKYHAPVVHFQKAFDEATKRAPADYWIWDGVHPTYSGHQIMADAWIRTVQAATWPTGR